MTTVLEVLKSVSKALAATVAAYLVAILAKYGLDVDVQQLEAVIGAITVGVITWIAPKNRERN